jgi:lactate dehydrogenase-like 2-hydroxyacid dehydrogenase
MPNARPVVCSTVPLNDAARTRLEADCSLEFLGHETGARIAEALGRAEGVLCVPSLRVDADFLARARHLRVVSTVSVGFDHIDVPAATARGVAVCHTPGVLSDAVADLTMAMILELARGLPEYERFARDGRWSKGVAPSLGSDLRGKALGIIGMGRIGRCVAVRAAAFGMRILYHDVAADAGDPTWLQCKFDEVLRESDFVSLHTNLTPETHHVIGAHALAMMKPTAFLINTARGACVDQAALCDALQAGAIAGAALDVLEIEPPPTVDPIFSVPNLILLPHVGSATRETRQAMLDLAVDNLLAVLRGQSPPCCLNPEVLSTRMRS